MQFSNCLHDNKTSLSSLLMLNVVNLPLEQFMPSSSALKNGCCLLYPTEHTKTNSKNSGLTWWDTISVRGSEGKWLGEKGAGTRLVQGQSRVCCAPNQATFGNRADWIVLALQDFVPGFFSIQAIPSVASTCTITSGGGVCDEFVMLLKLLKQTKLGKQSLPKTYRGDSI